MRNESRKHALNTDRKLACTFGQEFHVGLGGLSKDRQVKITANRLVMSCNYVQCVASAQACICNQKNSLGRCAKTSIALVCQMSIIPK
jgi:hypothetical protein